jgi:hypothetical protein
LKKGGEKMRTVLVPTAAILVSLFSLLVGPGCSDPERDTCDDECFGRQTRCAGNIVQMCGRHDDDICLEFGGDDPCPPGQGCRDGACVDAPATCGNGDCDLDEDCSICEEDCACSLEATCIDGTCIGDEPECGDGECETGEDCGNCEPDCGECPSACTYSYPTVDFEISMCSLSLDYEGVAVESADYSVLTEGLPEFSGADFSIIFFFYPDVRPGRYSLSLEQRSVLVVAHVRTPEDDEVFYATSGQAVISAIGFTEGSTLEGEITNLVLSKMASLAPPPEIDPEGYSICIESIPFDCVLYIY